MKICVTATSGSLDAPMDPHFGRSPYFILVDPGTMEYEALENPGVSVLGIGAQVAQALVSKGIGVLLTGKIGPEAFRILSEEGVRVITEVSGPGRAAVEQYKRGELEPAKGPSGQDFL